MISLIYFSPESEVFIKPCDLHHSGKPNARPESDPGYDQNDEPKPKVLRRALVEKKG